ncbi:MAG TPA: hypothetical protein VGG97_00210 [Bryobacteraceae bacterium]|jgi:hypothetical protein
MFGALRYTKHAILDANCATAVRFERLSGNVYYFTQTTSYSTHGARGIDFETMTSGGFDYHFWWDKLSQSSGI